MNTPTICEITPSPMLLIASLLAYARLPRSFATSNSSAINAKNTGVAHVMMSSCVFNLARPIWCAHFTAPAPTVILLPCTEHAIHHKAR